MIKRYTVFIQEGDIDDVPHYVGWREDPQGNVILHRDLKALLESLMNANPGTDPIRLSHNLALRQVAIMAGIELP
jgi:hypothetical protein